MSTVSMNTDRVKRFTGTLKATERIFPAWRTVRLGVHKTLWHYEEALKSTSSRTTNHVHRVMKKVPLSQVETKINLAVVTPADLGLKNPIYQQICDRAISFGLEKCSHEACLAIRLAYQDQPNKEWLRVAIEPKIDLTGCLYVFVVKHVGFGELWLAMDWFCPQRAWSDDSRFIFAFPHK